MNDDEKNVEKVKIITYEIQILKKSLEKMRCLKLVIF